MPSYVTHAEADKGDDRARGVLANSMLSVLAHGAVILCPIGLKVAGGTISEVLLLSVALLMFSKAMAALRDGTLWLRLAPSMPLMVVALLSVPNAVDALSALRELVQLLLYVAVGAWVFSEIRACAFGIRARVWAVRAALLLGVALLVLPVLGLDTASPGAGGTRNALLCNVCLFYALLVSTNSGEDVRWRGLDRFIMVLVPVLFAVSVFLQAREDPHVSAASMGESPAISQKYIEGYAAMCVLSEYPLFGVGIGNYQARIGEFYQGMPKDNTLLLGTRIGFGVILASIGLLGLTAFCYWLVRLMLEARGLKTHARVLPGFFVVVFVWAFFTPVFVGQVMMPIVFAHGWIMGTGGGMTVRTAQTVCLGGLLLLFAVVRVSKTDTTVVFEAESYAVLQAPMRVLNGDPSASGTACVVLPLGSGQGWRGTGKGSVTYRVDLLHGGRLFLWMRTLWGDGCTNAFFMSVNDGQRVIVGNDAVFGSWHWVKGPQIQVQKGLNYLTFSNHSDGTALDKIILTSSPFYWPEGLGEGITHFYDGFAGCDGNNTGSWTFVEGNWRVVPAVLEGASSAGDCLAQWDEKGGLAIGGFPVWHDYDAAVKVMLSGQGAIGLVFYHESPEDEMRLVLEAETDSALLSLRQKEGGQWKTLGQECVRDFCFDTWYELGFMNRQGQLICMLNGQPEMTIERALPRRGAIGLVTERVSGGYFDNVDVKFN